MLLISMAKALVEVAAMSIAAQMLVGMFAPSRRESNPIYRLFDVITRPIHRLVRRLMPRVVLDQHVPLASLFVLCVLWLCLLWLKVLSRA
jgi:uncharacterized protein YggT (Ycf19 family)